MRRFRIWLAKLIAGEHATVLAGDLECGNGPIHMVDPDGTRWSGMKIGGVVTRTIIAEEPT